MPAQEGVAAAAAATTAEAEAAPAPPRDKGWYSEWGWLPPEMLQLAMARMGGPELAAISGVCTAWRAASAQTPLWRALLVSEGLQPAGGGGAEAGAPPRSPPFSPLQASWASGAREIEGLCAGGK